MTNFARQVALVTAAEQGLGRNVATLLAQRGGAVHLTNLNGPGVEAVAAQRSQAAAWLRHGG